MKDKDLVTFIECFEKSITENKFVKLSLSKKRFSNSDLNNVYIKIVEIKDSNLVSFVYRHNFNDKTKNLKFDEAISEIESLLLNTFFIANLITIENNYELKINKKNNAKLFTTKSKIKLLPDKQHDLQKNRKIEVTKNYLNKLGLTSVDGSVIKSMADKYKQIEKYVEIFENIWKQSDLKKKFNIVDMGCGKGYLTFALYDHLINNLDIDVKITGVEFQQNLVNFCNDIAISENFKNLKFVKNDIENFDEKKIDVLIALHACDTATDDAIYKGIKANAQIIIVAPCCHKQIRKQIKGRNLLTQITKHGILLERQAELVTDGIRALILEKNGYKSSVFEFISTEHTGKNLMITAIKSEKLFSENIDLEISKIKEYFGIEYHYLEKLLEEKKGDWKNSNPICKV